MCSRQRPVSETIKPDHTNTLMKDYPTHRPLLESILDGMPDTGSSFTDVYRSAIDNHRIQVKVWRGTGTDEQRQQQFAERLSEVLKDWKRAMHHPNVAPFLGVVPGNRNLPALVTPLYLNGNINQYLTIYPEANRLRLLLSVANALEFMHCLDPPVVHSAIRGDNILISDDGDALLSDIGISNLPCDPNLAPTGDGMKYLRWMAPEVSSQDIACSRASDVYSFGMTILEVFSGRVPYSDRIRHTNTIIFAVQGILPPRPTQKDCPRLTDDVWNLIRSCLHTKAGDRPSIGVVRCLILALRLKENLDASGAHPVG